MRLGESCPKTMSCDAVRVSPVLNRSLGLLYPAISDSAFDKLAFMVRPAGPNLNSLVCCMYTDQEMDHCDIAMANLLVTLAFTLTLSASPLWLIASPLWHAVGRCLLEYNFPRRRYRSVRADVPLCFVLKGRKKYHSKVNATLFPDTQKLCIGMERAQKQVAGSLLPHRCIALQAFDRSCTACALMVE